MSKDSPDVHNGSFRQEIEQARHDIICEIEKKLRAYNELALQHSDLRNRPRVPSKDINSIANWHENHPHAILEQETAYVREERDLFALVPRTISPLRELLEKSTHFRLSKLWRKRSQEDGTIVYSSKQRINQFISVVIMMFGLMMLIAPLWILANVQDMNRRLGVITAFLVVFLALVTFTSSARPFETLAATAGYAAVLVVFLQIAP